MPASESGSERSKSREAAVRKEPAREDDNTCLYIGNIDKRLSQERLFAAFAEHGELDYCYIVYEPHSASDRANRGEPKQSRGYGFAKYKNNEEAARAREKLQGADLNGRRITVDFSKRNKPREPTPGRYLGKTKQSPVRKSRHDRRSYSRSRSKSRSKSSSRQVRRRRHHDKKRKHSRSRSRSDSGRRHRQRSYSRSPRR